MPKARTRVRSQRGFTLIELLVVVSIISLMSSIVITALNQARMKARDAARQEAMHTIVNAMEMYFLQYGCLPTTSDTTCGPAAGTYAQFDAGGWDYSSQGGGFMTFLKTAGFVSNVPVDPVNNMTGDTVPNNTYAFRYYCYPSPEDHGVHLSYWSEVTKQEVFVVPQIEVDFQAVGWTDGTFVCK